MPRRETPGPLTPRALPQDLTVNRRDGGTVKGVTHFHRFSDSKERPASGTFTAPNPAKDA